MKLPYISILLCANLFFFTADSTISFTAGKITQSSPSDPWMKWLADLDNDGDLEAIVGGSDGPVVAYFYPGWQAVEIGADGSYNSASGVCAGDVDLDGDVVWMKAPSKGIGTWTTHTVFSKAESTHGLAVADFDLDGDADILFSEFRGDNRLQLALNQDGKGVQWEQLVLGAESLHNIFTGDIEKDGDVDVLGAHPWGNGPAWVYFNQVTPIPTSLSSLYRDRVKIFPNPSNGLLWLSNIPASEVVSLVDLSGKVALRKNVTKPGIQLDLSSLPDGLYFVVLGSEVVGRVVKVAR